MTSEEIQKELEEDDIYLEYKNGFYLIEKSDKSYEIQKPGDQKSCQNIIQNTLNNYIQKHI
ncbi:MAG: hypothetical protein ACLUTO_04170 [Anaerostipes sp.]